MGRTAYALHPIILLPIHLSWCVCRGEGGDPTSSQMCSLIQTILTDHAAESKATADKMTDTTVR